jgi:hypothetical protein
MAELPENSMNTAEVRDDAPESPMSSSSAGQQKSGNLPVAGPEKKKTGKLSAAKKSAAQTASQIASKTKSAGKAVSNAAKPVFQKISSKASGLMHKAKGMFNSV